MGLLDGKVAYVTGAARATARLLEQEGRPFVVETADVRDLDALDGLLKQGVEKLGGRLDVVVANAGICNWGRLWEMSEEQWLTSTCPVCGAQ